MKSTWLKYGFILGGLFLPFVTFSQRTGKDTTVMVERELKSVTIPAYVVEVIRLFKTGLDETDIQAMNPDDAAGLVAKIPGTTIKSYGALGGLKTVSIRGLGGQHTAVIIDGFQVSNAQSGQINLGQIQSDGVVYAGAGVHFNYYSLDAVSANFTGNHLYFNTFLRHKYREGNSLKANVRYGSFMRREAYLQGDRSKGKWHFGAFGKYRDAEGSYPFEYLNGTQRVEGLRGNNDFQDIHFGFKAGRRFENNRFLKVYHRFSRINQGLPGAVLFYNQSADERMTTLDNRVMVEFLQDKSTNGYRVYANAGMNQLDYFDPTYLNAEGFIDNQFNNFDAKLGYIHKWNWKSYFFKFGVEEKVDVLQSNRESLGTPFRLSSFFLGLARKEWKKWVAEVTGGMQLVYDENDQNAQWHTQFTPNVLLEYKRTHERKYSLLYKRNFRLPSFNELYFGEIGNHNLVPEIAHQFALSHDWKIRNDSRGQWRVKTEGYFNRVQNKIVAIPTKNLFIWSMQNVAEAMVYGASIDMRFERRLRSDTRFEIWTNYTWQRVIDITPDAITYGHQVAYTPEHTANADFMFVRKGWSARISNNFVSGRYALNQNISANYLDPFWTMDAAVGYKHELGDKHKIGIQFNVRNLTNVSYAFIRSYVMPGRHYLLTLNYEIF
ncbi:MAG: TonB-dependent receptor plug domain-containing protein [Fluviicola sp.]